MQHVDRKSLYTDLEARIRYLHSFLDFGASKSTKWKEITNIETLTP